MTRVVIGLGLVVLVLASGCRVVVVDRDGGPPPPPTPAATYASCTAAAGCAAAADACTPVSSGAESRSVCTRSCSRDADCAGGGTCAPLSGGGGVCVEACTTSSVCEPGWSCQTIAATGATGCLPGTPVVPGSDTYETCSTTADCIQATDTCRAVSSASGTDDLCTHDCTSDAGCEFGGLCTPLGGGGAICLQRCATSAECELGWSCQAIAGTTGSACLPGSAPGPVCGDGTCNGTETCGSCATDCGSCLLAPYDECPYGTTPNPCGSATECWGVTVDGVMAGLCTDTCASDSECPLDPRGYPGTCLAFPGAPALCYEGCATSADCAPGWACKTMASGVTFPSICVPI